MAKTMFLKHDTAANWAKAVNFVPKKGEVIIYDDMDPPFKIGDGVHSVNEPERFEPGDDEELEDVTISNGIVFRQQKRRIM